MDRYLNEDGGTIVQEPRFKNRRGSAARIPSFPGNGSAETVLQTNRFETVWWKHNNEGGGHLGGGRVTSKTGKRHTRRAVKSLERGQRIWKKAQGGHKIHHLKAN